MAGEFALVTQGTVEVLVAGTPAARVTQESVEVLVAGTPSARITQVAIEVLVSVAASGPGGVPVLLFGGL